MENEQSRDLVNILRTCADIEKCRAAAYEYLADAYRYEPKISELFHKTANEERNHEYQFLMALRKFVASISASSVAVEKVEKYAEFASRSLDEIVRQLPSIEEALKMSILSETAFRQFHMDTAVLFEDPSLARLFAAMMAGDEEHLESLKRAHAEYVRSGAG